MANRPRKPEESYEQYRVNLDREKAILKQFFNGKYLWVSYTQGTYVKEKQGNLN